MSLQPKDAHQTLAGWTGLESEIVMTSAYVWGLKVKVTVWKSQSWNSISVVQLPPIMSILPLTNENSPKLGLRIYHVMQSTILRPFLTLVSLFFSFLPPSHIFPHFVADSVSRPIRPLIPRTTRTT